jgi:4,5-DOPA dioxygenase extradiol
MTARAPALFVSHGAPTVALEGDAYTSALARFGASEPSLRAIAVVSAHWTTPREIAVTSAPHPRLIYDFGGFPDALYQLRYPAPGAPDVAARAAALLDVAGFRTRLDPLRGLDHGVWIPLRLAWPSAEIPVIQLSLLEAPPADLLRIGAALAPLRDKGVLVMGSGGLVHNLMRVRLEEKDAPVDGWAAAFDAWVAGRLAVDDEAALLRWPELAPHATLAAPTTEHFDPLLVVLGARRRDDRLDTLFEGFHHANLGMRSFALRS